MASTEVPVAGLAPSRVALFSAVVAVVIFNVFASQVLGAAIAPDLGLAPSRANLIPTLSLLGYALGLLFVVPLADVLENRKLVLGMAGASFLSLLLAGITRNPLFFLALALVSGAASSLIQILVPLVGSLTPAAQRGRVLGNVMSGLLLGIMLSRPLATLLSDHLGWRSVYLFSALLVGLAIAPIAFILPRRTPDGSVGYAKAVASMGTLLRQEPVLRSNALTAALVMASFNVFWTSIVARLTSGPFHLSSTGIAIFSLAATAGAVSAPLMGRLGDRGWTRPAAIAADIVAIAGLLLAALAGSALGVRSELLGVAGLFVAAILLDFGVIGDQSLGRRAINMLDPAALGRRNGLFTGIFFLGGAAGSSVAGSASAQAGWTGVCFTGIAFAALALFVSLVSSRAPAPAGMDRILSKSEAAAADSLPRSSAALAPALAREAAR